MNTPSRKISAPLFAIALLSAAPVESFAQFVDTFGTIDSAWVANRYAPAGFNSVIFDGDSRLRLTLDQTGSASNRPFGFDSEFYNVQGRERPGGITGQWTLGAEVYLSSAFNTTTGQLASSELWAHTGTTNSGGDYATFGFTNADPSNYLDPAASGRAFRFQIYSGQTGYHSFDVANSFAFDTWHQLSITSTGAAFEFRLDSMPLFTAATTQGNDLLSAMVQGYNFGEAGSYSVHWDNVTASAIPEPATSALIVAVGALGLVGWRRRRTG